jgi:murein L,D-transpeptidase YcbB/YkuD
VEIRALGLAAVVIVGIAGACRTPEAGPQQPGGALSAGRPGREQQGLLTQDSIAARIGAILAAGSVPILERPGFLPARDQLIRLYQQGHNAPLWVNQDGWPTDQANIVLGALLTAPSEGLDSSDYSAHTLERLAVRLAIEPAIEPIASFDVGLSAALLRYLSDLHVGRVDPRTVGFKLEVPAEPHDLATSIRSARKAGELSALIDAMRPSLPLYNRLRGALAWYRALPPDGPLDQLPPMVRSVHPGEDYAALDILVRRLVKLGDLPDSVTAVPGSLRYDGLVVDAVRRFQTRHGLEPDGIVGTATRAALNVPVRQRIDQLALSLERLRWLPDLGPGRTVIVNIPSFRLTAWDSLPGEPGPSLEMGVIVGKSLDTETPVFAAKLQYLVFRPYWNVPASIASKEILPALRRDPLYLDRNDMELVRGPGDNAVPVAVTEENLRMVGTGPLRIRQRPGPRNSLGLVKFMFPNQEDVYLHDTPAQELFSRARRDFSHGCVRVENPVGLARWALRDTPGWGLGEIWRAMNGGEPLRVELARSIDVLIFYTTAIALADGTARFYEDIYRHDDRLMAALRAGRPRS